MLLGAPAARLAAGALYPPRSEDKKVKGGSPFTLMVLVVLGGLVVQNQQIPAANLATAKADVMFALHIQFDE